MEQHLVYDLGVESLFSGIRERVTPDLKHAVRALGIDLDKKLLPAYPKQVWVEVVDAVARAISPGWPRRRRTVSWGTPSRTGSPRASWGA